MDCLLGTNAGAFGLGLNKTIGLMLIEDPGLYIVVPLLIKRILNQFLGFRIEYGTQDLYTKIEVSSHQVG